MKRLVGTCAAIISVVALAACGSGNVGAGPTAGAPWALSTVNRPNLASFLGWHQPNSVTGRPAVER